MIRFYFIVNIVIGLLVIIAMSDVKAQNFQTEISKLTQRTFYRHANIGVSVQDVSTSTYLGGTQPDKVMLPASTLKLITSLSALELLGRDYTFRTQLTYDGYIDALGILKGNIYIKGGGDPSLGSDRIPGVLDMNTLLSDMISEIKAAGIKCVEGSIIADESIYNAFPVAPSWQWNDLGNYYASGAWGLNINENQYAIYYKRDASIGSLATISYWKPYIPNLSLSSEVTLDSANTEDNAYIFGGPYHYGKRIVGTIPQGKSLYKIKGSLPDPPSFLAYHLLKKLDQNDMGGHIYKSVYSGRVKYSDHKVIKTYLSPPLHEIVRYANDFSINMYCESMLKILGHEKRSDGSGNSGISVVKDFFRQKGLPLAAFNMEDGSGLSARNLISPSTMTKFLTLYGKNKSIEEIASVVSPVGERGTVRNMLKSSKAQKNMWLKSGSMDKTLCYAGYARTSSGKMVALSVFLNGAIESKSKENKEELEKILDLIYRLL